MVRLTNIGFGGSTQVRQIVASDTATMILASNGDIFFWGSLSWAASFRSAGDLCTVNPSTCLPQVSHPITAPRLLATGASFGANLPTNIYASYDNLHIVNTSTTLNVFEDPSTFPSTYFLVRAANGSLFGFGANCYATLGREPTLPYSSGSGFQADIYNSTLVSILPGYQFSPLIAAGSTAVYAQLLNSPTILAWGYPVPMSGFPDATIAEIAGAFGNSRLAASSPGPFFLPFPRVISGPWGPSQRRVTGIWGRYTVYFETGPVVDNTITRYIYPGTSEISISGLEFGDAINDASVTLTGTPGLSVAATIKSISDTSITIYVPSTLSSWSPQTINVTVEVSGAATPNVPFAIIVPTFNVSSVSTLFVNLRTQFPKQLVVLGTNFPAGVTPTFSFSAAGFSNPSLLNITCSNAAVTPTRLTCDFQIAISDASTVYWSERFNVTATLSLLGISAPFTLTVASVSPLPTVVPNPSLRVSNQEYAVFNINGTGFIDDRGNNAVVVFDPPGSITVRFFPTVLVCTIGGIATGPLSVSIGTNEGFTNMVQIATVVQPVSVLPPRPARSISASQPTLTLDMEGWFSGSPRPAASLVITSPSKRAAVTIPCSPESDALPLPTSYISCVPSSSLSAGSLEVIVVAYGATSNYSSFGTIVPSATVTLSSVKYAARGDYAITISGSNFESFNAGELTSVSFNSTGVFTIDRAVSNNRTLVVSFTTDLQPGALMAVVSANGGTSGSPVQVATIVPNPTITSSVEQLLNTATTVTITGANFHEDPQQNIVKLVNSSSGVETDCTISPASTTTSIICTNVDLRNYTTPTPLLAKVRAYQSQYSQATPVATVAAPIAPTASGGGSSSTGAIVLDDGAKTGIGVGVAAGVILLILIAVLVARWRIRVAANATAEKARREIEKQMKEMQMEMKGTRFLPPAERLFLFSRLFSAFRRLQSQGKRYHHHDKAGRGFLRSSISRSLQETPCSSEKADDKRFRSTSV